MSDGSCKGTLLIISGPSGVGKGTLLSSVLERYDPKDVYFSVSVTTRAPRPGEREGINYHYISREEYEALKKSGGLLEWNVFCDVGYGTPFDPVKRALSEGKLVILEIDVNGMRQVVKKMPDAITVFVAPPSFEDLERRIRKRNTETEGQLKKRLSAAERELLAAEEYKYTVINDGLEDAVNELSGILERHYGPGGYHSPV